MLIKLIYTKPGQRFTIKVPYYILFYLFIFFFVYTSQIIITKHLNHSLSTTRQYL